MLINLNQTLVSETPDKDVQEVVNVFEKCNTIKKIF